MKFYCSLVFTAPLKFIADVFEEHSRSSAPCNLIELVFVYCVPVCGRVVGKVSTLYHWRWIPAWFVISLYSQQRQSREGTETETFNQSVNDIDERRHLRPLRPYNNNKTHKIEFKIHFHSDFQIGLRFGSGRRNVCSVKMQYD